MRHEESVRDPTLPALTLPLLHMPSSTIMHSPDHPSTPPLQTPVSVPFRWEEEPGKPRSCSNHFTPTIQQPFKLELPPGNKITRTPSPITVLDGPSNVGRPKFSSFRWFREERLREDFYDSSSYSPDDGSSSIIGIEELFESSKKSGGQKRRGFFGRIKNGKRVVDAGSSCRFSPSSISSTGTCDSDFKNVKRSSAGGGNSSMRRNGSFSSAPDAKPSHFLASIYQGLKQVIQRKSGRKLSKGQDY